MNKNLFFLAIALLIIPSTVLANYDDNSEQNDCGLTDIKACFTGFFEGFFNAPLNSLITLLKELLTSSASTELFHSLWSMIVFACMLTSMIFIIFNVIKLVMYAEYPAKRFGAKEGLKNFVIIAVLLPLSFYLYTALLNFNSILTNNFLQTINTGFFEIQFQGFFQGILSLILFVIYLLFLIITNIVLVIRYLILSVGVVLFPLGIFMYYIDSLKGYGSLILNFLLSNIFAGFIGSLVLKIVSMLSTASIFDGYQIIFSIAGLSITDVVIVVVMFFVVIKSAIKGVDSTGFLTRFL